MIRNRFRRVAVAAAVFAGVLAASTVPASAITGGTPDSTNQYKSVGMLLFYEGTSRFRCTGTLVTPTVIITAAHCTAGTHGKTLVFFDQKPAQLLPRATDHDLATGNSVTGYPNIGYLKPGDPLPAGIYNPNGGTPSQWTMVSGTAHAHPQYSDFTDMKNWNDVGVVVLDAPVTDIPTMPLASRNMLDAYAQPTLNKTIFRSIGYGTHVQKPASGPQKPVATSDPIERQYADQPGQKLTPQIVQMNGNINDTRGTGGTCFGDSGGPSLLAGKVVTVTSYGYTDNCRYLGGYQRVDIPVVQDWLATFGVFPS